MTQSDVLIRYSEAKEALGGGCSDGYCCVEKPTGMHTNGGCKCASNPDFLRQQRMANIMRLAQEMSSEITRLRAALADAQAQKEKIDAAIAEKGGTASYPTEHAYLAACAAIEKYRSRAESAQAVGFAAGVEAVAKEIEGDDYNIGRAMSMAICCSGHECGCMGASVRDYLVYNIRALTPTDATAAAARVLLGVWPNDASFDAAFNACAASYHGGDQMQDEMDRTLATVSAALRAIAGDTP